MRSYEVYLFDLDGTLIDTTDLIIASFMYSIPKYLGIEPNERAIRSKIGTPFKKQLSSLILDNGLIMRDFDLDEIEAKHIDYQISIWRDYVKLLPDVKVTLEILLERGKVLGVVTSRKIKTAEIFLKHFLIWNMFKVVVTPEDTVKHKPDGEPLRYALNKINTNLNKGYKNKDTLYMGDTMHDVKAAHAADMDQALVLSGVVNEEEAHTVDSTYLFKNIREVLG